MQRHFLATSDITTIGRSLRTLHWCSMWQSIMGCVVVWSCCKLDKQTERLRDIDYQSYTHTEVLHGQEERASTTQDHPARTTLTCS